MTEVRRTGPVLTTDRAAEYCGIAKQTLRNLLAAGDGPRCFKHGRLNAFFTEDLDEWLAGRLTEQNPALTPHNR
ncbi:helix-turn-helix domain-containing protein [Microbacterium sp. EST19A]|uniref:helix-turn-helix domain-containing protein n=1 Tax=Microbacterium sp. EST19A TaxID=2862681 RepID=UPI001CBE836F|nr:helix-turn-helix domain-containing protein [Microbacterium sp. EST19A]